MLVFKTGKSKEMEKSTANPECETPCPLGRTQKIEKRTNESQQEEIMNYFN
jgi:hypothetical protein